MTAFPAVNSLLYIGLDEQRSYRSRVEAVEDRVLTIAAPIGAGDTEPPSIGAQFILFWTGGRTRGVLPVQLIDIVRQAPARWQVRATGAPRRLTRRQFFRGGGGEHLRLSLVSTGTTMRIASTLVDISERALRCAVRECELEPGAELRIEGTLGPGRLDQTGTVTTVRDDPDGPGRHVVVSFSTPSEPVAQMIRRYLLAWEITQRRRN
ncbi:PilZ domain-containing protein [Planobispora longispora]|uniref:PilZ domain-containing protein n=1 Tax=Planobispora longispora TaxID=28887 RepID=A0A8J3W6V1_9ACTN|nr:PilZ domain-containing protein [Planobispora longispora]BFE79609.1 hypothetical protein GCM10020093_022100 [Planobispora longispora]GIH78095.1 hypothetical protein Plo01_45240 [Planobispora longispora]